MSDLPKGIILLAHGGLHTITQSQMLDALPEEWRALPRETVDIAVEIPEQTESSNWSALRSLQAEQFEDRLKPLLNAHPDWLLIYFGATSIPLALDLGFRVGTWKKVHIFQHHHDNKDWRWPGGATPKLKIHNLPSDELGSSGSVVMRVFSSVEIQPRDTQVVVPDATAEVSLHTEPLGYDVFTTAQSLDQAASKFRDTVSDLLRVRPEAQALHLFVAGPVGLAFRLGTMLNKTMIPSIWCYKFNKSSTPRYRRAFDLKREGGIVRVLTEEEREQATRARAIWAEELANLGQFSKLVARKTDGNWLELLELGTEIKLEGRWLELNNIGKTPALSGELVKENVEGIDGFEFVDQKWSLNDSLLHALLTCFSDDESRLRRAARLFFLHEAIHFASQGMRSSNAGGIGRNHPEILEEVDYLADTWGLLHEFAFCEQRGLGGTEDPPVFFRAAILDALDSFVAFDLLDGKPRRRIQIRRLRRYLIWFWQYLRLGEVEDLGGALQVLLSSRPLINLSGPKTMAGEQGRIFYDLEMPPRLLELGVLHGVKFRRFGAHEGNNLTLLLSAFNDLDNQRALAIVRSLYDSL